MATRREVVAKFDNARWVLMPSRPWNLRSDKTSQFRANTAAADPAWQSGVSLVDYVLRRMRHARCLGGWVPKMWPTALGPLPDGQMTADDADEEEEAPKQSLTAATPLATAGLWPFPWAKSAEKLTQKSGGYSAAVRKRAPPGSLTNLWPTIANSAAGSGQYVAQNPPFTDTAVGSDANLFEEMSRWAAMAEERRTLGSHFGSVSGAMALYLLGVAVSPMTFAQSELGKFLSSIRQQYGANRIVMLHAHALVEGVLHVARSVPSAAPGKMHLEAFQLSDVASKREPWFAPGVSLPGIAYTRGDEDTPRILQLIPDAVLVVPTTDGYEHHLVIEWKTRHTPKEIEQPKLEAYWRQSVLQATAWWTSNASANPRFKPNGNSRTPRVHAVMVASQVTGNPATAATWSAWSAQMDAAAAQKVLVSVVLHAAYDRGSSLHQDAATDRNTYFLDDAMSGLLPAMRSHQLSDHALALLHDLLHEISFPRNANYTGTPVIGKEKRWRAISPLGMANCLVCTPLHDDLSTAECRLY